MSDTKLNYVYAMISGLSETQAVAVGYRFASDADFRSGSVESWALSFSEDSTDSTLTHGLGSWSCYVSGIWRSDSGRIYASLAHGELGIYEKAEDFSLLSLSQLSLTKVPTALTGIWGLDDQHVYAYGGSPVHGGDVFMFDGKQWTTLPRPPEWLLHIHGCAPDCIYGISGKSAYRWDGKQWHATNLRAKLSLACIWVESPDELYATDRGGVLFDGSADGWIERAHWDGPLVGVAKWRKEVWLGGEEQGLLKLKGKTNVIECIKPKIATRYFEARETLLIPVDNRFVISNDGVDFTSFAKGSLEEVTSHKPFSF